MKPETAKAFVFSVILSVISFESVFIDFSMKIRLIEIFYLIQKIFKPFTSGRITF